MAGPLQSILVNDERYFLNLCQYIHLNPLKAKLVLKPEEWEYSNYSEWIGIRNGSLFDPGVYEVFQVSPEQYRHNIENYQKLEYEKNFERILFDNPR